MFSGFYMIQNFGERDMNKTIKDLQLWESFLERHPVKLPYVALLANRLSETKQYHSLM